MKKPEKKNKTTEIIVFDDSIHFRRLNVHDIKKTKPRIQSSAERPLYNGVVLLIHYFKKHFEPCLFISKA